MCEPPQLTKFAQVRPLGTSFRYPSDNVKSRFSYQHSSHNNSSENNENCDKNRTSYFSSSQFKQNEGHFSEKCNDTNNRYKSDFPIANIRNISVRRRTKSSDSKESEFASAYKSSKMEVSGSAMQSLDRRIVKTQLNLNQ